MAALVGRTAPDRTRAQIDPRALDLLEAAGFTVSAGIVQDGSKRPNFTGIPRELWETLVQDQREAYFELVQILRTDFPTFCALLLRVVRKGGGTSPFIFNNSQNLIWRTMARLIAQGLPLFLVILKSRQLGITTFMAAWHYWQLWRQHDIQTLMIGHEVKLAERIVGIMRVFHDELPDAPNCWMPCGDGVVGHIKPELRAETKTKAARLPRGELYFRDRRSWGLTAVAKNIDQRGFQGTHFSGSESAFWPSLNNLMDALLPQLPVPGTPAYLQSSVVLESSPNGQNEFYDKWQLAKNPESEWTGIFLPWIVQDDEYVMDPPEGWRMTKDEKALQKRLSTERRAIDGKDVSREQMYYRHYMLLNKYDGAEEAWDQEYPSDDETCFMLSSDVMFQKSMKFLTQSCQEAEARAAEYWNSQQIKTNGPVRGDLHFAPLRSPFGLNSYHKIEKPKFRQNPKGSLLIWEYPKEGHHYVAGGDAAGGFADRDNSVGCILCVTCHAQAAEYCANTGPEEFTDHFTNLCVLYNLALAMPEVNGGYGGTVLKRMMQEWGYSNVAHEEKWDEVGIKKTKFGFSTQPNTKPQLISYMRWMIEDRFVTIASRGLLSELSTFQFEMMQSFGTNEWSGKAKGKKRDDRVLAFALALQAVKQSPKFHALLTGEQMAPSARDLGLNKTPQFERDDKLPPQLENLLGHNRAMDWVNPISGGIL